MYTTIILRTFAYCTLPGRLSIGTLGHYDAMRYKDSARGRYSLDFTAYAAAEKHIMYNTLNRQRRAMCRLALNVATQTLWDQIRVLAESLKPIYESLQEYILGADVIGVEETWWRLMDKKA